MTSRERILTVLRGEIPDRVPVAPFVQEEYLHAAYPERASVDRVIDAVELAEDLDFDLMAKHRRFEAPHFLKKSHTNWTVERSESVAHDILTLRTEIGTPRSHDRSSP